MERSPEMIRRITLENYMSHALTVIEPAEGLTVLVGENNCGKSAVVSALQTLCFNERGDYMVRHGSKETAVTVETDDGHTIEWRRKGQVVSYRIDGEDVHRLRGDVPERLHEILRLPRVAAEGDEFDVHFGEQKSPVFLLNQPGSKAALFFASSSDAADLMEMQRRHKLNVRDRKREEEALTSEIDRLERLVDSLGPLDDILPGLKVMQAEFDEASRLGARTVALAETIEEIHRHERESLFAEAVGGALASVSPPPEFHDTAALEELCADVERESARAALLELESGLLSDLTSPPEPVDTGAVEALLAEIERARAEARRRLAAGEVLAGLEAPPEPDDVAPLAGLIEEMTCAARERGRLGRALTETDTELAAVREEAEDLARAVGVCPTCGQPVDAEHLLSAQE